MTPEETLAEAYLGSGLMERTANGYLCKCCGASTEWNDVLQVQHAPECALKQTIDSIRSGLYREETMGETAISDEMRMALMEAVPQGKLQLLDQLVDGICAAESQGEALLGVERVMESCPYANRDFLTAFAAGIYRSPEQRQALRDYLMFEFSVTAKESELRNELESVKRDAMRIGAALSRITLPEHVTKRLI